MRRGWLIAGALVACSVLTLVAARRSLSEPAAERVGSEACKDCHEDVHAKFMASVHGRAAQDGGVLPVKMECETCHGPGSLHVAAGGDPKAPGFDTIRKPSEMPAEEINKTCLGCHSGGEQFYWSASGHARKNIACVECHSIHDAKDPGQAKLLKWRKSSDLCVSCHKSKHLMISKSAHMPVREGGMECASCHNPHGSPTKANLRAATVNDLCYSCHADKRGPLLWEHAPVRENCLNCHEPHGANNDKVLAAKRPFLCQRCHVATRHPATLYDNPDLSSNRLFNRSCTNCHSQVHGSNHPSGRYFLR